MSGKASTDSTFPTIFVFFFASLSTGGFLNGFFRIGWLSESSSLDSLSTQSDSLFSVSARHRLDDEFPKLTAAETMSELMVSQLAVHWYVPAKHGRQIKTL
jgi:hypothetical protein